MNSHFIHVENLPPSIEVYGGNVQPTVISSNGDNYLLVPMHNEHVFFRSHHLHQRPPSFFASQVAPNFLNSTAIEMKEEMKHRQFSQSDLFASPLSHALYPYPLPHHLFSGFSHRPSSSSPNSTFSVGPHIPLTTPSPVVTYPPYQYAATDSIEGSSSVVSSFELMSSSGVELGAGPVSSLNRFPYLLPPSNLHSSLAMPTGPPNVDQTVHSINSSSHLTTSPTSITDSRASTTPYSCDVTTQCSGRSHPTSSQIVSPFMSPGRSSHYESIKEEPFSPDTNRRLPMKTEETKLSSNSYYPMNSIGSKNHSPVDDRANMIARGPHTQLSFPNQSDVVSRLDETRHSASESVDFNRLSSTPSNTGSNHRHSTEQTQHNFSVKSDLLDGELDVVSKNEDTMYMTPEGAFLRYQRKLEGLTCQVCDEVAAGFHHGAYVCEACKKFFMRHANPENTITNPCPTGGHCVISKVKRGKCQNCRYRKCLGVGMRIKDTLVNETFDISKIPCRVCGNSSSGFHFGSLTCEGCKGFFRRTDRPDVKLSCKYNNSCPIRNGDRNSCKSCRYRKCLAIGMSRQGSRIGRQPNAVKYHCAQEIRTRSLLAASASTPVSLYATNEPSRCSSHQRIDTPERVPTETENNFELPAHSLTSPPNAFPSCGSNDLVIDMVKLQGDLNRSADYLFTSKEKLKSAFALKPIPFPQDNLQLVWDHMMKNFTMHTSHVVNFAKSVYGFSLLDISVRRKIVRDSMYPLMLLDLSRDYNMVADEYNYFDFTRQERESILHHFPSFEKIALHVRDSGRLMKPMDLDRMELTLLCILELYKNHDGPEGNIVLQLFHIHRKILEEYVSRNYGSKHEERKRVLFQISPILERMNQEHHDIIAQLKVSRSHLAFPELYVDIFQLPGVDRKDSPVASMPVVTKEMAEDKNRYIDKQMIRLPYNNSHISKTDQHIFRSSMS